MAQVRLTGLPKGASAAALELAKDAKEARFTVELAADAALGTHRGLRVELAIPHAEGLVEHRFAAGELRIDPREEPSAKAGVDTGVKQ